MGHKYDAASRHVYDDEKDCTLAIVTDDCGDQAEQDRIGRLFAASQEMLKALEGVLRPFEAWDDEKLTSYFPAPQPMAIVAARKAIAAAKP